MKKLLPAYILILVLISITTNIFASQPEFDANQTCDVAGTIKSIKHVEAYKDPCLKDDNCPVGAYNPDQPENYVFSILLSSVVCKSDIISTPHPYQSQFSLGKEVEIYIPTSRVDRKDSFEIGQKISGKVAYFFGNSFTSYIVEKPSESSIKIEHIESKENLLERIWKWFLLLF